MLLVALLALDIALLPFPTLLSYRTERPHLTAFQRLALDTTRTRSGRRSIVKEWVSLRSVSPYVIRAVLVSEDASFYRHSGFDWYEVQEAIEKSISRGTVVRGASTLTQQLVKNLFLSPSRNPLRKLEEAVLTIVMESTFSKSRILELYLNEIEWGNGIYGIQAAARTHFGKDAPDLTPDEAALLAAVIPQPTQHTLNDPSRSLRQRAARIRRLMNVEDPATEAATMTEEAVSDSAEADGDSLDVQIPSPDDDTPGSTDTTDSTPYDAIQRYR